MQFTDNIPIYLQIESYVIQQVLTNAWPPGSQLPAVRQLALDLTVNVNTIQRALGELIEQKLLITQRGRGNFVTTDQDLIDQFRQRTLAQHFATLEAALAPLGMTQSQMLAAFDHYLKNRKDEQHDLTD